MSYFTNGQHGPVAFIIKILNRYIIIIIQIMHISAFLNPKNYNKTETQITHNTIIINALCLCTINPAYFDLIGHLNYSDIDERG